MLWNATLAGMAVVVAYDDANAHELTAHFSMAFALCPPVAAGAARAVDLLRHRRDWRRHARLTGADLIREHASDGVACRHGIKDARCAEHPVVRRRACSQD